ncbi:MAG: hypothetical protein KDM91_13395 [Verrucomicrobiae bacterium]|nr:hypothetical protein [Verrucomicrobiae bacterium]
MSDLNSVEELLRQGRNLEPPDGFLDEFMTQFQERQRSEMLRQSARGLLVERVSTWLWGSSRAKWFMTAGAGSSLLAAGYLLSPKNENAPTADAALPASLAPAPAAADLSEVVELRLPDSPKKETRANSAPPADPHVAPVHSLQAPVRPQ